MPLEGFAGAPGARLRYTVTGEGPAVVLVHAGVADRRMWAPLAERLADTHRLVAFDLRGFGETEYAPGPYSEHEDVLAVVDAVGLDRPVLVGASYGGQVALQAAAATPERFSALVLLSTALPGRPPSAALAAFAAAEDAALAAGDVDEATEVNVRMWTGEAAPPVQDLIRAMQRRAFELQLAAEPEPEPFELRLQAVRLPVTVAYGDRDVEDFVAIAHHLAAALPQATLRPIAHAGHLPALEQPDAVAALLREVLPTSAGAGR